MNRLLKKIINVALIIMLVTSIMGAASAEPAILTDVQRNAIAMLNYMTVLTQETNAAKNSRIFMEQAYSSLVNNTYPNAVDSRTLSQITGLLDTMEKYRMVNVKRDRLQYIYEQNQAQAIRAAVPNPMGLLSSSHSLTPARLVASIVYMAVDSYTSYIAYTAEADMQYLKDGWALDDEEAAVLHESRKGAFSYMVKMVNDYGLPGEFSLTEETVSELVKWKNNDNVVARIRFLESNQKIYQSYGGYWLILADAYYNNGEFLNCLNAITTYESMGARLFRWDYEYARVLPLAIASAEQVYSEDEYVDQAAKWADAIVENTQNKDWALRYFAAQTYVGIYGKTQNRTHLQKAYDIVLDNVNYLVDEQRSLNATFLAAVKETPVPKEATKNKKDQINNYNKLLKETRKTEFAPVSEPLRLNCDLLFGIATELEIPDDDKAGDDEILHPDGERLFLNESLDDLYWFDISNKPQTKTTDIEFGGTSMVLPVRTLSQNATITVEVQEKDAEESVIISDWKLDRVEHGTEGDISTYVAIYTSEEAKNHAWGVESTITIAVMGNPDFSEEPFTFEYTTEGTKREWYDYLKVWEGHKNNWYDYLKVWDNSVNFIRVK
ncbi:MAG: hypothetical protein E7317_02550 [Clostridiales bacterium]|nr:hypothetical protein [Clostridiales bacterium]